MRKNVARWLKINRSVLTLEEFQATLELKRNKQPVVVKEFAESAFVYDMDGNVLGGYVDNPRYEIRRGLYGRYTTTTGYLHT